MKPIFGVISVLLLLRAVGAQEGSAQQPDPIEATRAAYREIVTTRDKARSELEEMKELAKRAPQQVKTPEAQEKVKVLAKSAKASLDPFIAKFRDVDWTKFDAATDKALLMDGLPAVARDPANPEKAIAAAQLFLKHFPDDRLAPVARGRWLPMAMITLDRDDEAVKELRSAIEHSKEQMKAKATMMLADVESMRGNFDAAKRAFAEVPAAGIRAMTETAALKATVIGAPAPALDGQKWIGGAAIPAADLKGKVTLLGFFATYAPSARTATGNWNTIRDQNQAAGLVCIGVTKPSPHGYEPATEAQLEIGGQSRHGMSAEQFVEHVTLYHTNSKMHYPFVVADEAAFKNFGVVRVPTAVLVDREGRITLVLPDLDDADLLQCALRRHLQKK